MSSILFIQPGFTFLSGVKLIINNFISLFVMVDPIAAIPLFLTLTRGYTPQQIRDTIYKCMIVTFGILVFFSVTGLGLLKLFGISLAALRIAGGLLLLKFALEQISGHLEKIQKDEEKESLQRDNIAIVPLSLPLLAGPGAISTVVLKSTTKTDVVSFSLYILTIVLVIVACYLTFHSSRHLFNVLGKTGLSILEKLMGKIVAALAIQFILTGIHESFPNF